MTSLNDKKGKNKFTHQILEKTDKVNNLLNLLNKPVSAIVYSYCYKYYYKSQVISSLFPFCVSI